MTPRRSKPGRTRRRSLLRRLLLLFALLLLAGGAFAVWVHQVGLPGPFAALVRARLRQMGWEAEASRVQVRWHRGLVARDLSLRQPDPDGFRLEVAEVALRPDWGRLLRGDFELESLDVLSGRLTLAPEADAADGADSSLVLSGLSGRVTVLPGDAWQFEEWRADLLGFEVSLAGVLTNLTGLGQWDVPATNRPPSVASRAFLKTQVRTVTDFFRHLALEPRPHILVEFHGDAARPDTISGTLDLTTPLARTPWGRATGLHLNARLNEHPPTNHLYHARFVLETRRLSMAGMEVEDVRMHADLAQAATNPLPSMVLWQARAGRVARDNIALQDIGLSGRLERTGEAFEDWKLGFKLASQSLASPEVSTGTNLLTGELNLDLADPTRAAGEISLAASEVHARRLGQAGFVNLNVHAGPAPDPVPPPAAEWGFWRRLAPWTGGLTARLVDVQSPALVAEAAEAALGWNAPDLTLSRLSLDLGGEPLNISDARLHVGTRETSFRVESDCDAHRLAGLLPPKAADWLARFTWEESPHVSGECRAILPPWTEPMPDLREILLPTVRVAAEVSGNRAAYRGVAFDSARLKVGIRDSTLRLREMRLERPEGSADLDYTLGLLSREFHWQLDCRLNPVEVAPAIADEVVRILALFEFTNAVHVHGNAGGTLRRPRRTDLALQLDATDFRFRGEPCDLLTGALFLTNRIVTATNTLVRHGSETAQVERLEYAVDSRELRLTNAFTRMDPMRVARAIGPEVEAVLAPYAFREPPEIRLGGLLPTGGDITSADLRFEVAGGPLRFWRFNFSDANGRVHWLGTNVTISDFDGGFYSGRLKGDLTARLRPGAPPNLAFDATVTNASLRTLVREVFSTTNQIEGVLSAHVVVTNGTPDDLDTWYGHGFADVRNGLLWDLPLFGIISRALNLLAPSLGNNVATAAQGTFTLDAGVLHTQDTHIECKSLRLAFTGTCSLAGELNARVVAEVMRRTPIVGPLVSAILSPFAKVFELSLSGSLSDPTVDLAHVPFLTAPVDLLKSLFQPRPTTPPAPAPAPAPDEPAGDEAASTPSSPGREPKKR